MCSLHIDSALEGSRSREIYSGPIHELGPSRPRLSVGPSLGLSVSIFLAPRQSGCGLAMGWLNGDGAATGNCPDCRAEPAARAERSEVNGQGLRHARCRQVEPLVCDATGYQPHHALTEKAKGAQHDRCSASSHRQSLSYYFKLPGEESAPSFSVPPPGRPLSTFHSRRPALFVAAAVCHHIGRAPSLIPYLAQTTCLLPVVLTCAAHVDIFVHVFFPRVFSFWPSLA